MARKLRGWQITGDREIVRMFAAVSQSMTFPWCHIVGSNIVVDLLTAGLPSRVRQVIDRAASFMLGPMALLLAWRTGRCRPAVMPSVRSRRCWGGRSGSFRR